MYQPAHFREDDQSILQAFIRDHSFGILVTQHDGAPFASHLPFLYDAGRGPNGTLIAHMARANPQWQSFDGAREADAVLVLDAENDAVAVFVFEVVLDAVGCDLDALRAHCARFLSPYKVPVEFTVVEAIPKTPGGKILRRTARRGASPMSVELP